VLFTDVFPRQDITNVLPVVDDALRGNHAFRVDEESEGGGEDLILFGNAEHFLGEYREASLQFCAPLSRCFEVAIVDDRICSFVPSRLSSGTMALQGAQPDCVKTNNTFRPLKSCKATSLPSTLGSVKSGARLPGFSPSRPKRLGVVASNCSRRQLRKPTARRVPKSKNPSKRTTTQRMTMQEIQKMLMDHFL